MVIVWVLLRPLHPALGVLCLTRRLYARPMQESLLPTELLQWRRVDVADFLSQQPPGD